MTDAGGQWPNRRSPAIDWLVHETRTQPFFDNLFGELCERLVADGLPVDRAAVHIRTLHPQFAAGTIRWEPGMATAELTTHGHEALSSDTFLNSPIRPIFRGEVGGIRQRLDIPLPEGAARYEIYEELRASGHVDYVVMPMTFVSGTTHAVSWATRQEGGFTTAELRAINDLMPLLALALELRLNRQIARNLLRTYVGTRAGERILAGNIMRGSGETIRAAIWYCDLRGFTAMSEVLPRDALIAGLNAYFDAMAEPVLHHGGEILKFIGDAMLAIFPLEEERACARALAAALDAVAGMRELNEHRREAGGEDFHFGLVLHVGDLMYGNIGARNRLDFTVIGPAVNVASRLDGLARELGREVLLSAEFAGMCERLPLRLRAIGSYHLRGIDRQVEVFGLPEGETVLPWVEEEESLS
ncbi:MAG: adenylate/guanylate cyclase domain-containing protein [Geminicoccaceae bacterium]|nr:adenylate/guanylate cyclase domain-containing protein [Geminicoccaceae bacterium]